MPDRLTEIRARLDAATPGPWKPYREAADWGSIHIGTRNTASIYADEDGGYIADRDLIAHAPADIAWLLAEVERLHERLEVLRHVASRTVQP